MKRGRWIGSILFYVAAVSFVSCGGSDDPVEPVLSGGVEIDRTELEMYVGDSELLAAEVMPAEAFDKRVAWVSSDEAVATVTADGTVTAHALGRAVVTASAGGWTARCAVHVVPRENLYAAGVAADAAGRKIAVVWKNGEAQPLTDGTRDAEARSIWVSPAGDVYAAGFENDGTNEIACVWKNGMIRRLTAAENDSRALAVCGSEAGTVYVAGFEGTGGGTSVARLWDGETCAEAMDLQQSAGQNRATGICIGKFGKVYVSGFIDRMDGDGRFPLYWLDGKTVALYRPGGTSEANAVSLGYDYNRQEELVFAAGTTYRSQSPHSFYWYHNLMYFQVSTRPSELYAVCRTDESTYTAGWELNGAEQKQGCVWRNQNVLYRFQGDGVYGSVVYTMQVVSAEEIYTAGFEYIGKKQSPVVWKNGERLCVLDAATDEGTAYAVFKQ